MELQLKNCMVLGTLKNELITVMTTELTPAPLFRREGKETAMKMRFAPSSLVKRRGQGDEFC